MNEEAAFLAALRDRSDDVTTRLVYADWLDEHTDRHTDATALRLNLTPKQVRALFTDPISSPAINAPGSGFMYFQIDPTPPLLRPVITLTFSSPSILEGIRFTTNAPTLVVLRVGEGTLQVTSLQRCETYNWDGTPFVFGVTREPLTLWAQAMTEGMLEIIRGRVTELQPARRSIL